MSEILHHPFAFSTALFEIMQRVHPGVNEMEFYEFQYCLDNLIPKAGWASITLDSLAQGLYGDGRQKKPVKRVSSNTTANCGI